jgi:hypothetical protein
MSSFSPLLGQDIEQILEKTEQALGIKYWESVVSLRAETFFQNHDPIFGGTSTWRKSTQWEKRPHLIYSQQISNTQDTLVLAFDGQKAWIKTWREFVPMDEETTKGFKKTNSVFGGSFVLPILFEAIKSNRKEIKYLGIVEENNQACYLIQLGGELDNNYFYLDKKTFFPIIREIRLEYMGEKHLSRTFLNQYEKINNVWFALETKSYLDGKLSDTKKIIKMDLNIDCGQIFEVEGQ